MSSKHISNAATRLMNANSQAQDQPEKSRATAATLKLSPESLQHVDARTAARVMITLLLHRDATVGSGTH